ncbi:MAG: RNA polymerase factor sigma-32 [Nitrospirae bacterium]|nr:RNA polymerase factor sigma-32 [Nitrospirota bacterium]
MTDRQERELDLLPENAEHAGPPPEWGEWGEEAAPPEGEEGGESRALVPYDPLQHYLAEVRRHPLLTREEERKLAIQYREHGDLDAVAKLLLSNLRIVIQIAHQYRAAPVPVMDLIQEGNLGLMQAVKKFDPYRGVALYTYAAWWIKAYILRYILANWRQVRIGTTQAQRKLFFNLKKEKERLEALGYDTGPKLLAERLEVREKDVVEMEQRLGSWEVSLDLPLGPETEDTLQKILPSGEILQDERLAREETRRIVGEIVRAFARTLKGRDLEILQRRLLADKPETLEVIGKRYGITRERVRQIEARLKKKLGELLAKSLGETA